MKNNLKDKSWVEISRKAKIHLKVETGLNRQGIRADDLVQLAEFAKKFAHKIEIEGIFTHFANIEDTDNPSFANLQLERFKKIIDSAEKQGIKFAIKHSSATAGTILYQNTHLDMVRLGIGLYGLYPSKETARKVKLHPVLSWKSYEHVYG